MATKTISQRIALVGSEEIRIAYEPVGIATGYSRTFNANWLGGEQPNVSVLYRVKAP